MRALLMRLTLLSTLFLVAACNQVPAARPPMDNRLYYPTGLAFVPPDDPDAGLGRIYVASSDFDRRFDIGWVTTIDLGQVRSPDGRGLSLPGEPLAPPSDGGSDQGRPVQFTDLGTDAGSVVLVAPFAGLVTADLRHSRLFVPSRSEGDEVAVMDISPVDGGVPLRCYFSGGTDCTQDSIPLAVNNDPGDYGIPAAPQPYGVFLPTGFLPDGGVDPHEDEIYVTHIRPASSPAQSFTNLDNFLVTLTGAQLEGGRAAYPTAGRFQPPDPDFSPIGRGSSDSMVITPDFLYVSGRAKLVASDPDVLVRVVDRGSKLIAFPQIGLVWASTEARGVQLRGDGRRLYLAAQNPGALLVVDVSSPPGTDLAPSFTLVRAVPLPQGPTDVQLLERPDGRPPLVVVSCTIDGSIVFYDDDLGQISARIAGVGAVPFAIAVDRRSSSVARLYVSNFGDARIAVVDVPLSAGSGGGTLAPRLIGHVGMKQYCLLATDDRNCVDTTP